MQNFIQYIDRPLIHLDNNNIWNIEELCDLTYIIIYKNTENETKVVYTLYNLY